MRSVYAKILLWCFVTLVVSLVAFFAVFFLVSFHGGSAPFERFSAMELEEARDAYEMGGPTLLARHLSRTNAYLSGMHYLTDAKGKDLVTGEDRSDLLARIQGRRPSAWRAHLGSLLSAATSPDGRYRYIVMADARFEIWRYVPYFLLILVALALVCLALAVKIASPLRVLARAVDRFGAGDLSVRVNSTQKDEIGDLSRAFDRMAERIATLLTAERRLLQDVSHELRSPLARLSFAAELMRTAEDRDTALARIRKEIHRLTDMVGALIQVTRAEGDLSSDNQESLQLDELVDTVVEDCRVEADARHCQIEVAVDSLPPMRADRELLRRAIENVVRNSIRYTPEASRVDIQLSVAGDTARIGVRDYGPGVPADSLSKIFQPFFRVDDSRDSSTGGVGLGLAIARRAIGLHHGRLWAQNAEPGLQVWIELPLV